MNVVCKKTYEKRYGRSKNVKDINLPVLFSSLVSSIYFNCPRFGYLMSLCLSDV